MAVARSGQPAAGRRPDTLRRWADEGRVAAWTTPGGHRRFERRVLERMATERRPGVRPATPARRAWGPPRHGSSASTASSYADHGRRVRHATEPVRRRGPRGLPARRAAARGGPRRVPRRRRRRCRGRADAEASRDRHRRRSGRSGWPRTATSLTEAVALFVTARRPFLAEIAGLGRRRSLDPARLGGPRTRMHRRCSIDCSSASSPRTRRWSAPLTRGPAHRPARPDVDPRARLQRRPVRPVARAARRLPAHLGHRDAVLRASPPAAEALAGAGGWNEALYRTWYLTGAVWTAGWLGLGTAVPARADAVRLLVRAVPVPRGPVHVPRPQPARVPGRGDAAAPVLHRGRDPGARGRGRDLLPERTLAAPGGGRGGRGDRPVASCSWSSTDAAGARVRARRRRPGSRSRPCSRRSCAS